MKIAIDGPAGAGKSTLARKLASKLGYLYIDTGAMYRALTLQAWEKQIDFEDEQHLAEIAESIDIDLHEKNGILQVYLNGKDVTEAIRVPQISELVSRVAAYPAVRQIMVHKQQQLAINRNVVMDGRDIGEYVLPDAECKFFITASINERARRRARELQSKGYSVELSEVEAELQQRDFLDSNRQVGALKVLPDARLIDTSDLDEEEVLSLVAKLVEEAK
ncbi:MAG: (d)CMP kinase [Methylocystaceae bacterium]